MKAANLVSVAAVVLVVAHAPASGAPADIPTAAAKCQACHNGGNAAMPRLEGQPAAYLAERIRGFSDLTRQSPHAYFMFDVNARLSNATVVGLAKYFAAQAPVEPAGGGALAAKGEKLYRSSDGARIDACQACHGARGEGGGKAPRLAGQRSAYLRAQLEDFSLFTRVHETMNPRVRSMSQDQINALVAFLGRD